MIFKDWYFILTIVIAVLRFLEVLAYYGTIHDEISMNSIEAYDIHDALEYIPPPIKIGLTR